MADKMSFEESLDRLDEIARMLESGGIGLDASLDLYAEAAKLLAFCNKKLSVAQSKLEKLAIGEQSPLKTADSVGREDA